jgi:DNA-binding winged helix-turn-helix (wHTH) protein
MVYHFGPFAFDEREGVLRRNGRDVRVQPMVIDLLALLIHQHGRVVPREVLIRSLWPDAIVTDASLSRLVKLARRAVGDDGREQRVIQTLHRRGYRFAAGVRVENGDGASPQERAIELARSSLEAALEIGGRDLRARVQDFAEACLVAIRQARRGSRDEGRATRPGSA